MLKNVAKALKTELKNIYGTRLNGNKCAFCGEELNPKEYCFCPEANRINPFYKRVRTKTDNLYLWSADADTRKAMLKHFFKYSGVPIKYSGMRLEDYKEYESADVKVKKLVSAYFTEAIKNYLTGKCLILVGNPGTGKTMLMSILVEGIIRDYMFTARYINCVELINEIQDTYSSSTPKSTLSVLNKYRDADFLFIDDLDKINATPDAKKLMYSIINDRYDRVLPTIISANSSIDVLDEKYFGEPTVSRLLERSVEIEFTQEDRRF